MARNVKIAALQCQLLDLPLKAMNRLQVNIQQVARFCVNSYLEEQGYCYVHGVAHCTNKCNENCCTLSYGDGKMLS
jgi:hypothetical protein